MKSTSCRLWHTAGASLLLLQNDEWARVGKTGQDACLPPPPQHTQDPHQTRLQAWVATPVTEGSRIPGLQHLTDAWCAEQDKAPRHSNQEGRHERMGALWGGAGPDGSTIAQRSFWGRSWPAERTSQWGRAPWWPSHHMDTNWGMTRVTLEPPI